MATGKINTVSGYKNLHSLNKISVDFLSVLMKDLNTLFNKNKINEYIVGYHLRHVFDTDSPYVAINTHKKPPDNIAEIIKNKNKDNGLHTFNHVLDSMYYPSLFTDNNKHDNLIISRINFTKKNTESYDFIPNEQEDFKGELEKTVSNGLFEEFEKKFIDYSGSESLYNIYSNFENDFNKGIPALYNKCIAGIHNLCNELKIDNTVVNYNALAAAIFQMLSYKTYGKNVITIVVRPKNYFNFVIGVSIFSNIKVNTSELQPLLKTIFEQHEILNKKSFYEIENLFANSESPYFDIQNRCDGNNSTNLSNQLGDFKTFPTIKYNNGSDEIEKRLAKSLRDEIKEDFPDEIDKDNLDALENNFKDFFKLCINFLHQKNEGTNIKYGLLLGNPFLLKYWKGSMPVPCSQHKRNRESLKVEEDIFFTLKELPYQIHLIENPEERVLVIPYFNNPETLTSERKIPAFIVELNDFHETFSSLKENILWLSEHRPYVFLTKRYPWSLACVAGPGAELRLFNKGSLFAYRDGIGWKEILNSQEKIKIQKTLQIGKELFTALLKVSLQLSPYVRSSSKGSFIIYIPGDENTNINNIFSPLFDNEPTRWNNKYKWLTGRDILKAEDKNLVEDEDVLPLIIQAGSLDGAIIIQGKRGNVKLLGQRLNLTPIEKHKIDEHIDTVKTDIRIGSKRTAAKLFVAWANRFSNVEGLKNSFAITISSDGPINIYYYNNKRNQVELKEIFKKL